MITRTVTVGAKQLLVRTPTEMVVMDVSGQSRVFSAATAGDITVTPIGRAIGASSSWIGKMSAEDESWKL